MAHFEKGINAMRELHESINVMTKQIANILDSCKPSIYLYGSVVLDDYKLGWSDIDILVLTKKPISEEQANQLVNLRQNLLANEPDNAYYRSFEGGMLTLDAFVLGEPDNVVYWGTSGQRITSQYDFDSFGMCQLLDSGILLYGDDVRSKMTRPAYSDLRADVRGHYEAIRQYAQKTGRDLYAYGWLLDISRCMYTLRTGKIIAKTAAGEWALRENICPCVDALARAVEVRKDPIKYKNDALTFDYAETLGDSIRRYADVLEQELRKDLNMQRKYYEAYDERYKTAHAKGVSWAGDVSTPIVMEVIGKYYIPHDRKILEIGCGEGRDSRAVLESGYPLMATDISGEAIAYCKKIMPQYESSFSTLDCLSDKLDQQFDFIFGIAVIHMLVLDEDRNGFYQFIRSHLSSDGIALICTMGDGEFETQSDITQAFTLQERNHETGKMMVAGTSCRMVSFATFEDELQRNELTIIEQGITSSLPNFNSLMYAVVKR